MITAPAAPKQAKQRLTPCGTAVARSATWDTSCRSGPRPRGRCVVTLLNSHNRRNGYRTIMHFEPSPTTNSLEEAVAVFVQHRTRLLGIAYRVLGSAVEAEDVVQEAWLRWQRTDRSVVVSPVAFLASTTTRLAINVAQSARVRRETYIGPWLPEPIDTSSDPEVGAQRAEALELALLLVLEKLSPTERAAYVLREAFDYTYPEIAEILQLTLVNVRKIVSRARKHLSAEQRESVDAEEHRHLLNTFVSAAQTGDVASLEALLTPDVVSLSDGNGIRGVARIPVLGRACVANLATAYPRFWRGADARPVDANGRAGVMIYRDGEPTTFLTIAASKEGIHKVMWVFNASKIAAFLDSRFRFAVALGSAPGVCVPARVMRGPGGEQRRLPTRLSLMPDHTGGHVIDESTRALLRRGVPVGTAAEGPRPT